MKKRKIFLSSFVLFALCVTGCNRNNNADAPSNNDKASISEVHNDTSELIDPTSEVNSNSGNKTSNNNSSNNNSNNNSEVHTHTWGDWQTVKAATCTEAGSEQRICAGCGASETRVTNALGHNFGNFVTTKEATCTETGEQKKTCSRCNAVETSVINALGHNWDNGVVTKEATAEEEGIKTYTCQRCHVTKTEKIPVLDRPDNFNVDLGSVETANVTVNFSEVTDNCMVSPKVKAYVDAMEAQEKTLDRPYHFSSLYGPDDYSKIASASDKGDGTTYAATDTGGVDVCQMLSRNDYSNTAKNYPIVLNWNNNGLTFSSAKLKFWSTADKSDLREVDLGANATTASLTNLYRARKYKAQLVTSDGKASQGFEFSTGDYPRTITMGDIKNVRDIGGYMTSYGVRTTQGMIYRGYYIDDKSGGHGVNYTAEAGKVHEEVMKIGYEIDVQSSSEINGRTQSCLSGATYKCLTLVSYENFLKQSSYQNLPEVFNILANADQKHVYFHCWGGADRTGMLAFFINAICGVSYTDLIEDFEITTETNNKRCHMHNSSSAHFPKFLNAFINQWNGYDANKTINQNCEKWLLEVAGVSAANILKVRQIMIPGYYDGMPQNIPSYTADGQWQHDDLAHWKVAKEDSNVKCNWARHNGNPCSVCNAENNGGSSGGGNTNNDVQLLVRNWDANPTAKTNSDGKEYFQLTDTGNKVVGAKIAITNYTVESDASSGTALGSDGKIAPVNDKSAILTYKITAPKVGSYQMIMRGKCSSSATEKTLAERNFTIKLNGQTVDIQNSRVAVTTTTADFVAAPTINLTGNEDVIKITCSDYRIVFDTSSYIVFSEY